jgi:hemolysin III
MQYRAGELAADRIIHLIGCLAGVVGSAILVGIAAVAADRPTFSASLVYSVCLLTMLGCSAAYNLASNASRREFLRKLDHAAIFLMIAGTYTPFTTCRLNGVWAIGMTAAVWTGAVTGAVIKLICPRGVERGSIVAYLALGWMILVGVRPMLGSVDDRTAILIGVGGVLYSIGSAFTSGGHSPSTTQYGTASCWSQPAVTTQLFCMAWCWHHREHRLATIWTGPK